MEKIKQLESEITTVSPSLIDAQFWLRVSVIVFTALSVVVIAFTTHSIDSPAFKVILAANVAVCALVYLSLIATHILFGKRMNRNHVLLLLVHDMALVVLLIGANLTAYMIEYFALNELPLQQSIKNLCHHSDQAWNFCFKIAVSIAFSDVTISLLLVLTTLSYYMLYK